MFVSKLQIKRLKEEKLIIETRYAVFRKSTGVDDLLAEVKTLKTELNTITHKLNRANVEITIYKQDNENLKLKQKIALEKPSTADAYVQTEKNGATFVEQMDWERVNGRAEHYKKHYQEVVFAYNELKEKYKKHNELIIQHENLKIQHQEKIKAMEELQWKYTQTKRICESRLDDINKCKEQIEMNFTKSEMVASGEPAYNELRVNYDELKAKHETTLKKCRETAELLDEIKEKYRISKLINDTSSNDIEKLKQEIINTKSELGAMKQQLDESEAELEAVKNKYVRAKGMLAERQERVENLRIFEHKYGRAKELLESRRLEILRLQALVNDKNVNNENAPLNK